MGILSFLERKIDMSEIQTVYVNAAKNIYFRELALYIAKSYIKNTVSKCEFKVYENGKEVHNNLYYMLNVSPNPNQNSSQFINMLVDKIYDDGSSLVLPYQKDRIYCADGFQIDKKPLKEDVFCNISVEDFTIAKKYRASEVFYFKLENKRVRALVDGVYESYGNMISTAIDAYAKANGKKYKLELEQFRAGDKTFMEQYENVIKAQLKTFMESNNAVYPQFRGQNLTELGASGSGNSADVISMRKEIFDTTAQAFKIPQTMMYGNITNMKDIVNEFITFAIEPVTEMISEELTRKTNSFDTWKSGNYVRVDTKSINHIELLDVADKVDKAISCGAMSIDEVRERLDLDALGTEFGKTHWMTKNYTTSDDALNSSSNV